MKMFAKGIAALLAVSAAAAAVMIANSNQAEAGSTVYVGKKVSSGSQVSMDKINHSRWDTLLKKYVDTNGYVNYRAWHASSRDRQALSAYLNSLSRANPNRSASRDAKLAFWINAYNAVTVQGILREYPTSSIRNHTAKLFGYNIWKDLQLVVGGQTHSLEGIEHKILRKMGEPRIHFAIVCASIGCPRLLNRAYTASQVQEQLEINAKDFFSRSQNFRYDQRNGQFQFSSIMNWFGSDFGSNQAAQLKTIAKWLPNQAARNAALRNSVRVSYLDYNWNLNAQATRPRVARRR
ncbi:MAG: DUF547 domain-containing protein [Planctomycetes bacterium]|nr:DUF547 domain-containing protein [Planctomycetota bacterium]